MAPRPRSERTARDNARAQALGYKSYYDWRAHDNGRIPPERPALRGEGLARARGHRSRADLMSLIRAGRVEQLSTISMVDDRGRFGVAVNAMLSDGRTIEFWLTERQAGVVGGAIDAGGPDGPQISGSPRTLKRFGQDDGDEDQYGGLDEDLDELGEAA